MPNFVQMLAIAIKLCALCYVQNKFWNGGRRHLT